MKRFFQFINEGEGEPKGIISQFQINWQKTESDNKVHPDKQFKDYIKQRKKQLENEEVEVEDTTKNQIKGITLNDTQWKAITDAIQDAEKAADGSDPRWPAINDLSEDDYKKIKEELKKKCTKKEKDGDTETEKTTWSVETVNKAVTHPKKKEKLSNITELNGYTADQITEYKNAAIKKLDDMEKKGIQKFEPEQNVKEDIAHSKAVVQKNILNKIVDGNGNPKYNDFKDFLTAAEKETDNETLQNALNDWKEKEDALDKLKKLQDEQAALAQACIPDKDDLEDYMKAVASGNDERITELERKIKSDVAAKVHDWCQETGHSAPGTPVDTDYIKALRDKTETNVGDEQSAETKRLNFEKAKKAQDKIAKENAEELKRLLQELNKESDTQINDIKIDEISGDIVKVIPDPDNADQTKNVKMTREEINGKLGELARKYADKQKAVATSNAAAQEELKKKEQEALEAELKVATKKAEREKLQSRIDAIKQRKEKVDKTITASAIGKYTSFDDYVEKVLSKSEDFDVSNTDTDDYKELKAAWDLEKSKQDKIKKDNEDAEKFDEWWADKVKEDPSLDTDEFRKKAQKLFKEKNGTVKDADFNKWKELNVSANQATAELEEKKKKLKELQDKDKQERLKNKEDMKKALSEGKIGDALGLFLCSFLIGTDERQNAIEEEIAEDEESLKESAKKDPNFIRAIMQSDDAGLKSMQNDIKETLGGDFDNFDWSNDDAWKDKKNEIQEKTKIVFEKDSFKPESIAKLDIVKDVNKTSVTTDLETQTDDYLKSTWLSENEGKTDEDWEDFKKGDEYDEWKDENDPSKWDEDYDGTDDDYEDADEEDEDKDDENDYDDENESGKKLKNPFKVWHRKKNKNTGKMTKSYFNGEKTKDGKPVSISKKEFKEKVEAYKKAKAKANQQPQQTTSSFFEPSGWMGKYLWENMRTFKKFVK